MARLRGAGDDGSAVIGGVLVPDNEVQAEPAIDCDVAIVGFGPVGTTLAGLLGRDGVRTRVFEREREIYTLPRAVHFDHEVMRIFQSLGLGDDDFGHTAPILGYDFVNGAGEVLFRVPIRPGEVTHQGWRPDYMFHQPDLERALRAKVADWPSLEVHLEHEVLRMDEHDEYVEIDVRDLQSGQVHTFRAGAVVGCDGANSFVRRAAGLGLDDLEFDEPWLVVDATVDTPPTELGLPPVPTQHCDPARPVTYVPVAGPYIRWEFMLLPGESADEMMQPEKVRALVGQQVDPTRVKVIRSAVYDFHALVASSWGTRRVFLAGDSAHQTPPFLGQGMCAGIRDVANLAWRLRWVAEGRASSEIFASYQTEREPHVRALIGTAVDMGRIICVLDAAAAAHRDAGFLVREDRALPSPASPDIGPGFHLGGDAGGHLALQARIRDADGEAQLLDDITGPGFNLLVRAPARLDPEALKDETREGPEVSLFTLDRESDVDGAYWAWFDKQHCDAVLVRPDHIVFGARKGPEAARRLLSELRDRFLGKQGELTPSL